MRTLVLYRGLPGAGKSTRAKIQAQKAGVCSTDLHHFEADKFFELNPSGKYVFNNKLLAAAHGWCQGETRWGLSELSDSCPLVLVANTFSQLWELEPYVDIANEFKAALSIVDLFDAGFDDEQLAKRCIHNVPVDTIAKMRARWEKVTLTCVDQVYSLQISS